MNLDTLTPEIVRGWKSGETLLLSGKLLTGRDAAHKKLVDLLEKGRAAARGFQQSGDLLRGTGRLRCVMK